MSGIEEQIAAAIREKLEGSEVAVTQNKGGHYSIDVVSKEFEGKNMLQSQRLVLSAVSHLMKGDGAPLHAVDSLKTRVP